MVHSTSTWGLDPIWLQMAFETQLIDICVGIEKLHSIDDGEIIWWCLDLHEASLLTIECDHLIKLDSQHHFCVWALIDLFLKSSDYTPYTLVGITVTFTCVSIR